MWVLSFNGTLIGGENIFWALEAVPSWLIDGANSSYWLANNENAAHVDKFSFDSSSEDIKYDQEIKNGSDGVVHLEYNLNKSRMFGACYGSQQIDISGTPPSPER